jgi:hypothetical protein
MIDVIERQPAHKPDDDHVDDDGCDFDLVLLIAAKFRLKIHVARWVIESAGLRASEH